MIRKLKENSRVDTATPIAFMVTHSGMPKQGQTDLSLQSQALTSFFSMFNLSQVWLNTFDQNALTAHATVSSYGFLIPRNANAPRYMNSLYFTTVSEFQNRFPLFVFRFFKMTVLLMSTLTAQLLFHRFESILYIVW